MKKDIVGALRNTAKITAIECAARFNRLEAPDSLVLFADPRGGSTWLFEILQSIPKTASSYEPFHLELVPEARKIGIDWNQHVPEGQDWPELKNYIEAILTGRKLNAFTASYSKVTKYFNAQRMLVKFIRAKMMLPWMIEKFRFVHKPIVLFRHPLAILASSLEHPAWQYEAGERFGFPEKNPEPYLPHLDFLSTLKSKPQYLMADWCLKNNYLLNHPQHNRDWISTHYEHLLLHPLETVSHIFTQLKIDPPQEVVKRIDQPSRTTLDDTFKQDKMAQLRKWKSKIDLETQAQALRILEYFEIDIYDTAPTPNSNSKFIGHVPQDPAV